eukprot:1821894-Prymnesium_polylepis.1
MRPRQDSAIRTHWAERRYVSITEKCSVPTKWVGAPLSTLTSHHCSPGAWLPWADLSAVPTRPCLTPARALRAQIDALMHEQPADREYRADDDAEEICHQVFAGQADIGRFASSQLTPASPRSPTLAHDVCVTRKLASARGVERIDLGAHGQVSAGGLLEGPGQGVRAHDSPAVEEALGHGAAQERPDHDDGGRAERPVLDDARLAGARCEQKGPGADGPGPQGGRYVGAVEDDGDGGASPHPAAGAAAPGGHVPLPGSGAGPRDGCVGACAAEAEDAEAGRAGEQGGDGGGPLHAQGPHPARQGALRAPAIALVQDECRHAGRECRRDLRVEGVSAVGTPPPARLDPAPA